MDSPFNPFQPFKLFNPDPNPNPSSYRSINALALAYAANLAYEDKNKVISKARSWGFTNVNFLSGNHTDTQAFVAGNENYVVVAFRGTQELHDVWTDLQATLVQDPNGHLVHKGFAESLDDIWTKLDETIQSYCTNGRSVWFAGHSLGAALATLAADRFYPRVKNKPKGVYTFGSPRVGNEEFAVAYDRKYVDVTFRFVNNDDLVTRVPHRLPLGYKHVGTLRYFDARGQLHESLSAWKSFLDKWEGRVESLLTGRGLADVDDHHMPCYVKLIQDHFDHNTPVTK